MNIIKMRLRFLIRPLCLIVCIMTLTNILRIKRMPGERFADSCIKADGAVNMNYDMRHFPDIIEDDYAQLQFEKEVDQTKLDDIRKWNETGSINYKIYEFADFIEDENNGSLVPENHMGEQTKTNRVTDPNHIPSERTVDCKYDISGRLCGEQNPHMYSCSAISDKWPSMLPPIVKQTNYDKQRIPPNFFDFPYVDNAPKLDYKKLILNPRMICSDHQPHVLVMCNSAIQSFNVRQAVRNTWGNASANNAQKMALRVVFIIGDFNNTADQHIIDEVNRESRIHKDILQIQVDDSYRAMTAKRILGLRWGLVYCPTATHVIYATDDIVININKINNIIKTEGNDSMDRVYYGCSYPEEQMAITSGRYEMHSEPPTNWTKFNLLPRYNIGFAMLLSRDSAAYINALTCKTPLVFPDDAYIGILLKMVGIAPKGEYKTCGIRHRKDRKLGVAFAVEKFSNLLWDHTNRTVFVHLYERNNTAILIEKIWKKRPDM
ncbi:unnamed protein product [Owenia fusiformis]|uniref:Hexosyltransferase n=1 Tax=Owenia fusiformis TaxID=6347 RepID=A0A8J1UD40_OWEFU|nr:unnamed protein product [Owenia fusiformis]